MQAGRKSFREFHKALFETPITDSSDSQIRNLVQKLTGTILSPGLEVTIIHVFHELRSDNPDNFVLCPLTSKSQKSTLHAMKHPNHIAFGDFLQNIGRFVLKKDSAGAQINNLEKAPYLVVDSGDILFNDVTCYGIFNCMGKIQRNDWIFGAECVNGKHSLNKVFDLKIYLLEGQWEYQLNAGFMALHDFYAATSIYAEMAMSKQKRGFFNLRKAQYAKLDGKDGRRDWRAELKAVLEDYLDRFPEVLTQVKRRKICCEKIPDAIVTGDMHKWATGPSARKGDLSS